MALPFVASLFLRVKDATNAKNQQNKHDKKLASTSLWYQSNFVLAEINNCDHVTDDLVFLIYTSLNHSQADLVHLYKGRIKQSGDYNNKCVLALTSAVIYEYVHAKWVNYT